MRYIAIGASAGGVEALQSIMRALPEELDAAIFVVVHFPPESPSVLPAILGRAGRLRTVRAEHGAPIERGVVYVAPPGHHLLVQSGRVSVTMGPKENGHRPAVDPLFRSLAAAYGRDAIAVVLSGNLADGSAGLLSITRRGGTVVVQDPEEAMFPGMPRSAIRAVAVDHVLPLDQIPAMLLDLVNREEQKPWEESMRDEELEYENEVAERGVDAEKAGDVPGTLAGYGCPDCGGTLWELASGGVLHFRCRIGHAWNAENLLAQQFHGIETALWTALRALEESAQLSRQLSERMTERGSMRSGAAFRRRAEDAEENAQLLRRVLVEGRITISDPTGDLEDAVAGAPTRRDGPALPPS